MSIGGILLTHAVAASEQKPPFFFSRFNLERMKELGNTHFCFHCGGGVGFKPGPNGEATNSTERGYNPMKRHDPVTHADGVIGDADKYDWEQRWLRAKIGKDFPFVVCVPSV